MQVTLNRWVDNRFENNNRCNVCGKLATTATWDGVQEVCASCLNKAQQAISQAILKRVGEVKER